MSTTTDRRAFLRLLVAGMVAWTWRSSRTWARAAAGNFERVYRDPVLRERFRPFLENVFRLFPPDQFHDVLIDVAGRESQDDRVYQEVARRLPEIAPLFSQARYGLPALKIQKAEMSRQVMAFLGGATVVRGYLEIGSTGRYVSDLQRHVAVEAPLFVVNDVAPSYAVTDLLERRRIRKIGTFVPLGNYDPIAATVADASLDLVTNFIGLHHCPADRLDGFVRSIHRVLRPGGRLLHRDHDTADPTLELIAGLAHDVFNVGVGLSWQENRDQVRLFRSIDEWSAYFVARGFRRTESAKAQPGDPTANLLIELVRV